MLVTGFNGLRSIRGKAYVSLAFIFKVYFPAALKENPVQNGIRERYLAVESCPLPCPPPPIAMKEIGSDLEKYMTMKTSRKYYNHAESMGLKSPVEIINRNDRFYIRALGMELGQIADMDSADKIRTFIELLLSRIKSMDE